MFLKLSEKTYCLNQQQSIQDQIQTLMASLGTSFLNFNYFSNGKKLQQFQSLNRYSVIQAIIPLLGGKGGYGAKLKTQGGKKVRPNDNMFSRDTQGQKLVYSTMEREFKQFVVKKIQEDKKVTKEREQFKIMQNTLKEGQSFMKLDRAYKKQIQETQKSLAESIIIGKKRNLQKFYESSQKALEKPIFIEKVEKIQENEKQFPQKIQVIYQQQKQCNLKRPIPQQFKQEDGNVPQKKIKVQIKPDVSVQKPKLLSAQQKFKLLFKK